MNVKNITRKLVLLAVLVLGLVPAVMAQDKPVDFPNQERFDIVIPMALTAPVAGYEPTTPDMIFTWTEDATAGWYKLIVKSEDGKYKFKTKVMAANCFDGCALDTSFFNDWKPRFDREHKWFVKSYKPNGDLSQKTSKRVLDMSQLLPKPINQVFPLNEAVIAGETVLAWQDDYRSDMYRIRIRDSHKNVVFDTSWLDDNDPMITCADGICSIPFSPEGFSEEPVYNWQVLAKADRVARKTKSGKLNFTVLN